MTMTVIELPDEYAAALKAKAAAEGLVLRTGSAASPRATKKAATWDTW
jgi:hypothetical protein